MELTTVVLGLVVGAVVGMTSTGGGALLTPALLLLGVRPSLAVGSDVLAATAMKLVGGGYYSLRGEVHLATVARLAAGSIPGALAGVFWLSRFPASAIDLPLRRGIGIVLVVAGLVTLARLLAPARRSPRSSPGLATVVALGFGTGLLVSVTSIGSGSILLAVLTVFFPLAPRTVVGTDLVHALVLSATATVGHLFAGRVDLALGATILVGGIPGVLLGARLAHRVPERALRVGLAGLLVAVGLHLAVSPPLSAANPRVARAEVSHG